MGDINVEGWRKIPDWGLSGRSQAVL